MEPQTVIAMAPTQGRQGRLPSGEFVQDDVTGTESAAQLHDPVVGLIGSKAVGETVIAVNQPTLMRTCA
ncbi:hypothetical protein ACQEU3_39015 [Spirillospora sp. CA-253888]